MATTVDPRNVPFGAKSNDGRVIGGPVPLTVEDLGGDPAPKDQKNEDNSPATDPAQGVLPEPIELQSIGSLAIQGQDKAVDAAVESIQEEYGNPDELARQEKVSKGKESDSTVKAKAKAK